MYDEIRGRDKYFAENEIFGAMSRADSALSFRFGLLKTEEARLVYLRELLKFSSNRNSFMRNLSRQLEASQKSNDYLYTNFLINLSRRFEGKKYPLVKRELEVMIRRKMAETEARLAERKKSYEARAEKIRASRKRSGAAREKVRSRYLKRLASSAEYSRLSPQEKIEYLREKLFSKGRSGAVHGELLAEIGRLRKASQRAEAKGFSVSAGTAAELVAGANREANIEVRRKSLSKAKAAARKEGKGLPPEARLVLKYGQLSPMEIAKARELEASLMKGDYFSAAKALEGTKFRMDEAPSIARRIGKERGALKQAFFLADAGMHGEAERVARAQERLLTKEGVFNAIKIRRKLHNLAEASRSAKPLGEIAEKKFREAAALGAEAAEAAGRGSKGGLWARDAEVAKATKLRARAKMVEAGRRLAKAGLYHEAYRSAGALKKGGHVEASKGIKEMVKRARRAGRR